MSWKRLAKGALWLLATALAIWMAASTAIVIDSWITPSFAAQLPMLAIWWLRLALALATGFFVIIVVIDKWWLKGFNTAEELKKGNYAVAGLYALVIWVVLRAVN
jgi:glucan phosphoethanolaminetransferase (alkaline phosphatase superfamily)